MAKNELILVIPRQKFGAFLEFRGFKPVDGEPVDEWMKESSFQDRPTMETDPSHQQIIPYILLRYEDLVFRYCRTKKGGEARLHDMYSIGIGGHINPIDESGSSADIIMKAAVRELEEEMHITQDVKLEHIGYINDDESEVGKVHLGFVMQAWLTNPDAAVREDALSKGEWVKQDNMLDGNEYETWSQLIIEGYLR